MNQVQKEIAKILKARLERIEHDYEVYLDYPLSELENRRSEINAIAYEIAESFSNDEYFNRPAFMVACGIDTD